MNRRLQALAPLLLGSWLVVLEARAEPPASSAGREEDETAARPTAEAATAAEGLEDATAEADGDAGSPGGAEEATPCPTTQAELDAWIDRVRHRMHRTVCVTAYRFDSLFGNERVDVERDETFGRAGALLVWDDYEGWNIDTRFKAKVTLPQMENRLNAFFGRADDDSLPVEHDGPTQNLPAAFGDTDAAWLAGFGYSPVRNVRNRVDVGVGMKIGFPMEPYVNARYRRHQFFGERALARFQQVVFWRSDDGFGTLSRVELERLVGSKALVRWSNNFTVAQHIDGVRSDIWLTLYHRLTDSSAVAWQSFWHGLSDELVPVRSYGLRMIVRKRMKREWLVLESRAVARWRRPTELHDRELYPELGFGLEIQFGG